MSNGERRCEHLIVAVSEQLVGAAPRTIFAHDIDAASPDLNLQVGPNGWPESVLRLGGFDYLSAA